jgi:hypothetical protein
LGDGRLCRLPIGKGHKAETTGAAGIAVADNLRFSDLAESRKAFAQPVVVCVETESAHKKFLTHVAVFPVWPLFNAAMSAVTYHECQGLARAACSYSIV